MRCQVSRRETRETCRIRSVANAHASVSPLLNGDFAALPPLRVTYRLSLHVVCVFSFNFTLRTLPPQRTSNNPQQPQILILGRSIADPRGRPRTTIPTCPPSYFYPPCASTSTPFATHDVLSPYSHIRRALVTR